VFAPARMVIFDNTPVAPMEPSFTTPTKAIGSMLLSAAFAELCMARMGVREIVSRRRSAEGRQGEDLIHMFGW
jgi:hypothetical protein